MKPQTIAALVILAAACCSPLPAQNYTFQTILECNNLTVHAYAMNGSGLVVGDAYNIYGPGYGMTYFNGKCQTYSSVLFYGVTDTGGLFTSFPPNSGEYLLQPGSKPQGPLPNYPGTNGALYCCMDTRSGTMAGNYNPSGTVGIFSGFFYRGGKFTSLPWSTASGSPSYEYTLAALNNTGTAVGTYQRAYVLGFVYQKGKMSLLQYPGAKYTYFQGLNDNGIVVGSYILIGSNAAGIFTYDINTGAWTDLGFQYPYDNMIPVGISNTGVIVLQYSPSGGMVLATPTGN